MTSQEDIREQRRQLNELRNQYDKELKDEQRELRRQRNGHITCHCRNWMDPWQINHCPQQTQPPVALPARESSVANKGNLNSFNQIDNDQLKPLPSANIKYDPSAIIVTCTDPRPPLPPDPWLGASHYRQTQQTQLPFDLPARESSVANIKSLDSFFHPYDDQCSSKSSTHIKYTPSTIITEQGMGQTPYASRYPEEHLRTHDPPELSLHSSRPTTPEPHSPITDHHQDVQTTFYSVAGEAKPSTAQKLSTARIMITRSLKLLAEVDLNIDPHTKHLTRMRSAAETSLSELSYHIQNLMGDDPLDYSPLGMEKEYHRVTEELADPKNLDHDQDPIKRVIQEERSKLQIMDT